VPQIHFVVARKEPGDLEPVVEPPVQVGEEETGEAVNV
jgi:hypothetical protein